MSNQDRERERFDAWAKSKGFNIEDRTPQKYYAAIATEHAWAGWQAALSASATEPVAERGSPHGNDADWVLAMAGALGTDSGILVPIVPSREGFRQLFNEVRWRAAGQVIPEPPTGWKLVPIEPTQEMFEAARCACDRNFSWEYLTSGYRAMLKAAPTLGDQG